MVTVILQSRTWSFIVEDASMLIAIIIVLRFIIIIPLLINTPTLSIDITAETTRSHISLILNASSFE